MNDPDEKLAALIAELDDLDKRRIRAAVDALVPLATGSSELRESLNALLNHPQRRNRWPIAYLLGSLPEPSAEVLEVLVETLGSPDSDIRWAVLLLLVRSGKTDARIVNLLLDLLETGDATQRRMAIYCIRDLRLQDEIAIPVFLKRLNDSEPMVRVDSATSLKLRPNLNSNDKDLLLKVFLNDPDSRVRSAAAVILAGLGPASEEFLTALRRAAESESTQIKKAAGAALALLEKKRSAPAGR